MSVTDDWNGFGQRGTGSGTTTFDNVGVPADHVLPFEERFPYQTAFYQLNLLATLTGIARGALADVVEAVQSRTRNFSHANAPRVRDDAQVLARVGEIAASVYAAEAATLRVADSVQAVADAALAGADEIADLVEASEIESSTAQVVVSELVLRATSDLFDALGASATARPLALDRHWRNARTVASHNPRILKARVVGAHAVNGTPPPYAWSIGGTRRRQEWADGRPGPATPRADRSPTGSGGAVGRGGRPWLTGARLPPPRHPRVRRWSGGADPLLPLSTRSIEIKHDVPRGTAPSRVRGLR